MGAHGAVASYYLGEEAIRLALEDWRQAPVRPEALAMLAFLEVMTSRPGELTRDLVRAVRSAGVTAEGIREAAYVCALFSTITRVADALQWDVPDDFSSSRTSLVKFGYRLPPGL